MSHDLESLLRSTLGAVDEKPHQLSGADLRRRARRQHALARMGLTITAAAVIAATTVTILNRPDHTNIATPPSTSDRPSVGPSSSNTADPGGFVNIQASDSYQFDTLPEMVATSALVVEAEVLSQSRGDVEGGGSIDRLATMHVIEVFKGTPPQSLTVVEPGWDASGRQIVMGGLPPLSSNARVLLFLIPSSRPGARDVYLRVSSAGEFILNGEESITTGQSIDPAVQPLKKLSPAALRNAVRAARAEADAGGVKPRKPLDFVTEDHATASGSPD
ncbi:MAG: hypothetical protein JWM93_1083 [Frankiales bacterium]|nr:hypothetical protein [Frankiales bacterium]